MTLSTPGRLKIFFGFSAKYEAQNVFFIHSFIHFKISASARRAQRARFSDTLTLSNLRFLDNTFQFAMFENCLGPTALKMYNQLDFTGMTKDIATVLKQMEHVIIGDLNETYERYNICL